MVQVPKRSWTNKKRLKGSFAAKTKEVEAAQKLDEAKKADADEMPKSKI